MLDWLNEKRLPVRFGTWTAHDVEVLNKFQLLTAKEVVYLVNLSKRDYLRKANKWLPKIQAKVEELGGGQMIPFSVEFEQEVRMCVFAWEGGGRGGSRHRFLSVPLWLRGHIRVALRHDVHCVYHVCTLWWLLYSVREIPSLEFMKYELAWT